AFVEQVAAWYGTTASYGTVLLDALLRDAPDAATFAERLHRLNARLLDAPALLHTIVPDVLSKAMPQGTGEHFLAAPLAQPDVAPDDPNAHLAPTRNRTLATVLSAIEVLRADDLRRVID